MRLDGRQMRLLVSSNNNLLPVPSVQQWVPVVGLWQWMRLSVEGH